MMKHSLPSRPGVYFFKNRRGTIIYIGKARCLKSRIRSYFQKDNESWKIGALLQELEEINYIETASETEALLLEAQLINLYQPKYNVLLKNGQPYLYIKFTDREVTVVRNKKGKGKYIGPFLNKTSARRVYIFLKDVFRLSLCKKTIPQGCLNYHLGRCAGSCRDDFDYKAYQQRLTLAYQALTQDRTIFLAELERSIKEHNKRFEFEQSKQLYHYITHLNALEEALTTRYNFDRFVSKVHKITEPAVLLKEKQTLDIQLQKFLNLPHPVRTVDCFDISHFQSAALVGSCVRFNQGTPDPQNFRRFKIKTLRTQNDYAALQEIVQRRYKKEDFPDLILIDGGKGQLNAILPFVGSTPCVSLAKREERLFCAHAQEGILLDIHSPEGKLLIALRDYTHHFAITYHRTALQRALSTRSDS